MRSIPAVIYAYFFILTIIQLFPLKAIMLDVVDGLKVNNRKNNHKGMNY